MALISDLVGGRSCDDAEQIAFSISHCVKDDFPMNEVPEDIKLQCESLVRLGKLFKEEAHKLVERLAQMGVEKS